MRRAAAQGLALFVLGGALGMTCGEPAGSTGARAAALADDPFGADVVEMQRLLSPGAATLRSTSGVARSAGGVGASWELDLAGAWLDYAAWSRDRLAARGFEVRSEVDGRVILRRRTSADVYTVTVQRVSDRAARIEYTGAPW